MKYNHRICPSPRPRTCVSILCSSVLLCCLAGVLRTASPLVAYAFAPAAVTRIQKRSFSATQHALRSSKNDSDENESTKERQPHIVVLGGGFGGINTALTLPTLPWSSSSSGGGKSALTPKITLIDKSERFVFLPLLYELCVGDASLDEVAPTFASLLEGAGGKSGFASLSGGLPDLSSALRLFSGETYEEDDGGCEVSFLRARVEGIDVDGQKVVVSKSSADGDVVGTVEYDALVVATGSEVSLDAVPGASKRALPFYTVEQAWELKRRLSLIDLYIENDVKRDQKQPVDIIVVGGGYSGVELALNLVDRFGGADDVHVTLVHRGKRILEYATEHNRNAGTDRMKAAGVKVMTSTSVEEVLSCEGSQDEAVMSALEKLKCKLEVSTKPIGGTEEADATTTILPATLLLWTAGATPTSDRNAGIRNSLLPRDAMGRVLTSPTLNIREYPNVFAVGDCGRPKKVCYPGTAQVAIQQATVAAWNVYATLTRADNAAYGESKLLPFKFLNLGEMMTLGSDDATISTLGGAVELSGPAASWLRRWIYAVRMPTARQGIRAAADGTSRKLARSSAGSGGSSRRRKSKPVDWR